MEWEDLVESVGDTPPLIKTKINEKGSFLNNSVNKNHNSFTEFYFGQTLYENQIDIVKAITTSGITEVDIVEPRQSGKTSAVAVSCAVDCETVGIEWNKVNAEPYRIGIFGPKLAQAQIDLSRIKLWAANNPEGKGLINWRDTTNSVIRWHNGCEIHAMSASEQTESEGFTFNKAILEEAQKISDHAVSQVIMPMVGAVGGKIIKIGTVRAIRNHFWRSCNKNPRTTKVAHHWLLCGNYLRNSGFIEYNGNKISKFILERMPMMLKEKYMLSEYFPNTPDFMFYGDMEYDDFLTQYELEWLEQYGLFMSREEIERMFLGTHPFEFSQVSTDCDYFAGLDFATGDEQDETAVSIFKKIGNLKRKVFGITWGNLPIPDQKRELVNLLGSNGQFHCKTILGDVGGNGQAVIEDLRAEYSMPVYAVAFGSTDKDVKTVSINMKTSMYNDFRREIQNGMIQHYGVDSNTSKEVQVQYRKDRREWETLEQETRKDTINKRIQSTDSEHDDCCCSDILALRAMKLSGRIMGSQQVLLHRIPYAVVTQSPFQ